MKHVLFPYAIYFIIIGFAVTGWVKNIIKLSDCDFEPSYKSEVLRIIGIPIAPMGMIIGYMDLKDVKQIKTT